MSKIAEKKAKEILEKVSFNKYLGESYIPSDDSENCEFNCGFVKNMIVQSAIEMAQWKDEQLNNLKDEIQSNLCASSGFNDEYSHGYQDCGMKVMEMIDKILN